MAAAVPDITIQDLVCMIALIILQARSDQYKTSWGQAFGHRASARQSLSYKTPRVHYCLPSVKAIESMKEIT